MAFYILRHADKEQGKFYNSRLRHQDEPISQRGCGDSLKFWPTCVINNSRQFTSAATCERIRLLNVLPRSQALSRSWMND